MRRIQWEKRYDTDITEGLDLVLYVQDHGYENTQTEIEILICKSEEEIIKALAEAKYRDEHTVYYEECDFLPRSL